MNLPDGAKPTKPWWPRKWVEQASRIAKKWVKNAFDAARVPTTEFHRGQRAFVVATLTLLLILVGVICCIGVLITFELTDTFEDIPGVPHHVVRPSALVWGLLKAFFIYLVVLHVLATFRLVAYGKAALQAMEYAYLLLGVLGLAGVASVGIERAGWERQLYADQVAGTRSTIEFYVGKAQGPLCGQLGPRLPSVPTAAVCQWLEEANSLAHRPLDGNSAVDRGDVHKLIEDGEKLDATIPSAARARGRAITENGEKLDATIPDEPSRDLTENQREGFRWFRTAVSHEVKNYFQDLLERGGWIAKIDAEMKDTQESLLLPKSFGFYFLAFAIALRITKLSVETLRIGPTGSNTAL